MNYHTKIHPNLKYLERLVVASLVGPFHAVTFNQDGGEIKKKTKNMTLFSLTLARMATSHVGA